MAQGTNGAWLALGVAGAVAAAGVAMGGRGSMAKTSMPENCWVTLSDGHRWATDGAAMIRDDAPALAPSSRRLGSMPFITDPSDHMVNQMNTMLDGTKYSKVLNVDPKDGPRFNKRYGPLLRKAAKALASSNSDRYGNWAPLALKNKSDEVFAIDPRPPIATPAAATAPTTPSASSAPFVP